MLFSFPSSISVKRRNIVIFVNVYMNGQKFCVNNQAFLRIIILAESIAGVGVCKNETTIQCDLPDAFCLILNRNLICKYDLLLLVEGISISS